MTVFEPPPQTNMVLNTQPAFIHFYLFAGRGSDGDRGVGDRVHHLRVRRPRRVHRHPPQDQAQEDPVAEAEQVNTCLLW